MRGEGLPGVSGEECGVDVMLAWCYMYVNPIEFIFTAFKLKIVPNWPKFSPFLIFNRISKIVKKICVDFEKVWSTKY